jgi:hypothetical protein
MAEWTIDDVAARFAEAAETGRRLPPVRVQGYFSVWPAFVRKEWEGFADRDYARHRGVSDTAVHKAIRAGRITPEADARAAASAAGLDRFEERHWRELERQIGLSPPGEPDPQIEQPTEATQRGGLAVSGTQRTGRRVIRSRWFS